jgi:hypothetical protein
VKRKALLILLLTAAMLLSACGSVEPAMPPSSDVTDAVVESMPPEITESAETPLEAAPVEAAPSPEPVETAAPEPTQEPVSDTLTCTLSISCATILDNLDKLSEDKLELIPENGCILNPVTVEFEDGESVFDVLQRTCRERKIHLEFQDTPLYSSSYIEGINNLYEFDCGALSGWMYRVNGIFPNYGCSSYVLSNGDVVELVYTCDLGADVGGGA